MKPITILGIVLIIVGIVAFAYQGISYTKKEKVLDLGPIEATADKKKTIPIPPIVGGLLFIGGVALVITGARKS